MQNLKMHDFAARSELAPRDAQALAEALAADLEVAVLLPCYNEAAAIGQVVADFRQALPRATIYVYDNNSTDGTAEIARSCGAVVRREPRQGKGYVVRRMFADISADIYILCDADATYDAAAAPALIDRMMEDGLDMVVGARCPVDRTVFRPGHAFGNRLLTGLVRRLFGEGFADMLSGYRVFSRRFVKSFPAMSEGFEVETELTIHALELQMPAVEMATRFQERPVGSLSKLNTIRDGVRILGTITALLKHERPFLLFGALCGLFALGSLALGYPLVTEFLRTGLVPRFPTAILASALMLLAALFFFCGLILDTVAKGRKEAKRLKYLEFPAIAQLQVPAAWRHLG